jgi:hypothetical protein
MFPGIQGGGNNRNNPMFILFRQFHTMGIGHNWTEADKVKFENLRFDFVFSIEIEIPC